MFDWFRKDRSIDSILRRQKRKRRQGNYLPEDLTDVLFLDYDGVINIDLMNFGRDPFDYDCMMRVNRLCHGFGLKIVVISSWKDDPIWESILHDSGLSDEVRIMGMTKNLQTREEEIKEYLSDHPMIEHFLIIDDHKHLGDLRRYQVMTELKNGLTEEKFKEARSLYSELWGIPWKD